MVYDREDTIDESSYEIKVTTVCSKKKYRS